MGGPQWSSCRPHSQSLARLPTLSEPSIPIPVPDRLPAGGSLRAMCPAPLSPPFLTLARLPPAGTSQGSISQKPELCPPKPCPPPCPGEKCLRTLAASSLAPTGPQLSIKMEPVLADPEPGPPGGRGAVRFAVGRGDASTKQVLLLRSRHSGQPCTTRGRAKEPAAGTSGQVTLNSRGWPGIRPQLASLSACPGSVCPQRRSL